MEENERHSYPAVYVIFTITQAIRRGIPRRNIWREFQRQKILLTPRLAFWVPLCKKLGVIKETDGELRITSYTQAWLNKPAEQQVIDLIEAWQDAPRNKKSRQFRKKLLWKLKYNQPLTTKDQSALNGLDAVGLTIKGNLTGWGKFFIKNEGTIPTPQPTPPCQIENNTFIAPLHPTLLWHIEAYLRPSQPGVYPLDPKTMLRGDPKRLFELLEKGLQKSLPDQIKTLLLRQPSICISEGIVLEFSSPAELAKLRRQPVLRKYFEKFLSSQSVLIARQNEKMVYELLKRRGVYLHTNEEQPPVKKRKRTHFAQKMIMRPVGKSMPKLVLIEKYKQLSQALDIVYRVPGCNPEQRRITPLAIEQRGEHTYIIAHCQNRRGQRTFRLDRMDIPGTW